MSDAKFSKAVDTFMGGLVTGWLLIAEMADTDGNRWIEERSSAEMTPWLRFGMLAQAASAEVEVDDE